MISRKSSLLKKAFLSTPIIGISFFVLCSNTTAMPDMPKDKSLNNDHLNHIISNAKEIDARNLHSEPLQNIKKETETSKQTYAHYINLSHTKPGSSYNKEGSSFIYRLE